MQWQVGPQIEEQAEPSGGLLALLGALYEQDVQTVAVHGGLASYLSVCDDYFAYVPADVIVPGILQVSDIADVAAALEPRPLLVEGLVDGRDRLLQDAELEQQLSPLKQAYQGEASKLSILGASDLATMPEWFRATL